MIPGITIKSNNMRTVAMVSEVEHGVFVVEPMHFLTLKEAKRQAEAALPWSRRAGLL